MLIYVLVWILIKRHKMGMIKMQNGLLIEQYTINNLISINCSSVKHINFAMFMQPSKTFPVEEDSGVRFLQ